MNTSKQLNCLSYQLTQMKSTLKYYQLMQINHGRILIDLQKQLKKLENGYYRLNASEWFQLNAVTYYNRIDYIRSLVEETYNKMSTNQQQIERIRSETNELQRKLKNEYKVVLLRC